MASQRIFNIDKIAKKINSLSSVDPTRTTYTDKAMTEQLLT